MKARIRHWLLCCQDRPTKSTLVEMGAIPTVEIDLDDLPEIIKEYDVMLRENDDGTIGGYFDVKGKRFRMR